MEVCVWRGALVVNGWGLWLTVNDKLLHAHTRKIKPPAHTCMHPAKLTAIAPPQFSCNREAEMQVLKGKALKVPNRNL